MIDYTAEQIQDSFDALPEQLKAAITSTEVRSKIEALSKKYNLHIDQLGELMDEVGLVLLNLHKSSDFVNQTARRLNISSKLAFSIAQEVNRDVFDSIKMYLRNDEESSADENFQSNTPKPDQTISSLERAGGFNVEQSPTEPENNKVTSADRGKILEGLENPPSWATNGNTSVPANLPTENGPSMSAKNDNHTEPLVDYLLNNPSAKTTEQVATNPKPQPVKPVPQAPKGPDPYRETF